MMHLPFWASVWEARKVYGPIRGRLSIPVPLHVFVITVVWKPVCEHTRAVKGGFEDYLITFQIEPSGNSTLPLCHLPHETDLRYKLRLN